MPKNRPYSELLAPMRPDIEEDRRQSMSRAFGKEDQFLDKISQLESSGGVDTDHPMITQGMHTGDKAIGQYGLMPNTIQELANRRSLQGDPTLEPLKSMSDEEMRSAVQAEPELEQMLARQLARHVLNKQKDEDKAAYSWQMGHNKSPKDITPEDMSSSEYVTKFKRLKTKMDKRK